MRFFDTRKSLPLNDLVPEAIETLSFKLPVLNTEVWICIYNKTGGEVYREFKKPSNGSGIVKIQARQVGNVVADVDSSWFTRYQGYFHFKFYVEETPIAIETNFQNVVFEFKNVVGADTDYLIDLSGSTVIVPEEPTKGLGLNFTALDSTFILI